MNNFRHFMLRRALPFGSAAVMLVGCASQKEVDALTEQVAILQKEVNNRDNLLETYGIEIETQKSENERLREENQELYNSLHEAQSANSSLKEQLENRDGKSTELEDIPVNDAEDFEKRIDASNLFVFDTTKIPVENDSFTIESYDHQHNYRPYWLVQACQFKEFTDSGVWNYYGPVFDRNENENGEIYYQNFMGFISGDNAYAAHMGGYFMAYDGSFSSCYRLAYDNPVPLDTYVSLNEFLISKGLSDYVRDSYTMPELENINYALCTAIVGLDR